MNVRLKDIGEELVPELKDLQSKFMLAGGVAAAVCAIGAFIDPAQFVRSFLPAYMWILSITLGALGLAMVHQVSGGAWGVVPRERWGRLQAGHTTRPWPSERGDWTLFYTSFANAVRGRGPVPVDPWDAVAALEVLEAAERSAATGQVVALGPGTVMR